VAVDPHELLQAVDEARCLDFLAELVRFKSYPDTPGETLLARFLAQRMQELGLQTALQHVEGERYNALGTWRGTGGGKTLLLAGHLDTNPATEGWTVDPWAGQIDDRFIYGLGVSNMKAGDAAFFCAVKTLLERGYRPRGHVTLAYVVGELQGGIGTLKAIEQGLGGDCFIIGEPTDLQALTLHAGTFNFVIELVGATRHVSKREEAVDALAAACAVVPRINRAAFSGAAGDEHRLLNRANVGVLRAALTPEFIEWRPPQVADFARLVGTARYAPSQSQDSVLADLRRLLDELEAEYPGLKARVYPQEPARSGLAMLPFEVSRRAPVVQALNRAYEQVRQAPQPTGAVRPMCFYWTDAAHLQHRAGLEGVVCGPGGRYNTMPDERVDVADYLDAIRIYMLAILDICA
jgi:acetylornithine deacetylase